jgi:hypothetical protein
MSTIDLATLVTVTGGSLSNQAQSAWPRPLPLPLPAPPQPKPQPMPLPGPRFPPGSLDLPIRRDLA